MADRQEEFDEAWARIVADLTSDAMDTPPADPEATPASDATGDPRTASDTRSEPGPEPPPDAGPEPDAAPNPDAGLAALFAPLRRADPAPDEFVDNWSDEGHFTPEPPPEIPEGTPLKRLAWVGTLGGPAVLAITALTGWDAPRVVTIAAGLAFLAGFAALVWQMPEAREDGWDDGARL